MAIWIAIAAMAAIILILAIFYLINSIHRYGKWLAPVILIIVSLFVGTISGINIYKIKHPVQSTAVQPESVQKKNKGSVVQNGLQTVDEGMQEDKDQQEVLKDLQKSFAKVGSVKFDESTKTYTIEPTNSQNVDAINYVLKDPSKAHESGYDSLTSGILKTSGQIKNGIGSGYTLQMVKPNSNQVIYSAKDGKVVTDVVANQ